MKVRGNGSALTKRRYNTELLVKGTTQVAIYALETSKSSRCENLVSIVIEHGNCNIEIRRLIGIAKDYSETE